MIRKFIKNIVAFFILDNILIADDTYTFSIENIFLNNIAVGEAVKIIKGGKYSINTTLNYNYINRKDSFYSEGTVLNDHLIVNNFIYLIDKKDYFARFNYNFLHDKKIIEVKVDILEKDIQKTIYNTLPYKTLDINSFLFYNIGFSKSISIEDILIPSNIAEFFNNQIEIYKETNNLLKINDTTKIIYRVIGNK